MDSRNKSKDGQKYFQMQMENDHCCQIFGWIFIIVLKWNYQKGKTDFTQFSEKLIYSGDKTSKG